MTQYDPTLFDGAAAYYARYRVYPQAIFDELLRTFGLDGTGRLLDIATGTGQLAVPLAKYFADVMALDPDAEMLVHAQKAGREAGARNIAFVRALAEDLPLGLGVFRLATVGTALHWMDREKVLEIVYDMLEPAGAIAVVGAAWTEGRYDGVDPRAVYGEIVARYLGPERRAGAAKFNTPMEPHADVIARTRFGEPEQIVVPHVAEQTADDIVGLLFSTSFANRRLLGDDAEAFEQDVRRALADAEPSGVFRFHSDYEIVYARKL
jgi:ubiquinone/menaquinone biosynthesis C-methylase UbiE